MAYVACPFAGVIAMCGCILCEKIEPTRVVLVRFLMLRIDAGSHRCLGALPRANAIRRGRTAARRLACWNLGVLACNYDAS